MLIQYNSMRLSDLGEVIVTQKREFEGASETQAPQRARVTLSVKLLLFERSYGDNYTQLKAAAAALASPNQLLVWQNSDTGENYVSQTATVLSEDFPEEWGTYVQELNIAFLFFETLDTTAQNLPLTFIPTGGAVLTFDKVTGWTEGGSTERFDTKRSNRRETRGRIDIKGVILGDMTLPLETRRAALAAQRVKFVAAMNSAEGRLTFGTGGQQMFDGTVRVADFKADVNQAVAQIEYSFSASYTLFPDETNYATVEANIAETDNQTGEISLAVSGKIAATNEVMARAKLASLTAALLKQYGYLKGQQLELNATPNLISANSDGDTFTELTFSGRWRKWSATNQRATYLRKGSSGEAVPFGNVRSCVDHYQALRFDEMRDQRQRATNNFELSGTFAGDMALTEDDRRKQLLAAQRRMKAEVNSQSGTLVFGGFSQAVRVDEFRAEVNQAVTGIDWSFKAHYTLFPNESSYATVTAAFAEADNFNGEVMLTASGKIQAADEATARAKLAAVVATALEQYGYTAAGTGAQQLEFEATPNLISANDDGDTFTELNFSGRWKRFKATNQPLTYTPTGASAKPVPMGNVRTFGTRYTATRFDLLRPHRERGTMDIEAAGTLTGDLTVALEVRRPQLLGQVVALNTAMNTASGTLTYGASLALVTNQVVRVDEFKADINEAETGIEWTMRAHYTVFPDEANYATVTATAEETDNFTGEVMLAVNGRIQAATEAGARTKLAAVLAAFVTQYGYTKAQQLELRATPNLISANEDGDTFTELSFSGSWRRWKTTNQAAFFKATSGKTPVPFGNVKLWEDGYRTERFDQMRSERRHSTGTITGSGTYCGDLSLSLKDRRAALLALQRRMKTECNNADGTLTYGDFSQVLRMEEFIAHINQAETGIDWSFSASYSLFPNEGGYATCEFAVDTRDDIETGDRLMNFAGQIDAPNASLARAKLATLRTATLAIYGFNAGQLVRIQSTPHDISANGDRTAGVPEGMETAGDAEDVSFLRLTFSEDYRQRMPGSVLSSQYTISSRDDTSTNMLLTTYAGSVTATGPNADAALAVAITRAMQLGENKELQIDTTAFLKSKTLTIERRQISTNQPDEFLRVQFSYEYQSKLTAGRAYMEMNTQTLTDAFGPDAETVNGFVVAVDFATAMAIYQQEARAAYAGRLIRQETVTQNLVKAEKNSFVIPPVDTLTFTVQQTRLEFAFTAHKDKPAGRVTASFAMAVQRDLRALKITSRLRGSVYALNRAAADSYILTLTAPLGQLVNSDREEDREFTPEANIFVKLDFDDVYEGRLTGDTGVVEMNVTESVTYSATRWAVQPVPFATNGSAGVSVVQAAGLTEGSREIRGSVSAASKATALAWANRHQKMLTGDNSGGQYPNAPRIEVGYDLAPRVDGVVMDGLAGAGSKANVQIYRVNFTFSEILPNYLPTA